ncbi:hypothetical protein PTSG_02642 [Salpingoeca rosetta]|uniref:Elongator complex protein 6 n=1 Tax=Salpingoeca rosetta (strain ATCC 50818 / BSB-021) TaxID=946362 RepID=F2U2W3_SALR5|nr:uncharacterized protein PTSG_02642 [Salpingoeca rosetta]EGD81957.1 hypothetical protein PTSG_02642 [Salpingoeca rosetta]|eukprot:XP_004996140.1 hypothetical protein PTSG_02642 [Salpingoeca rosetta]
MSAASALNVLMGLPETANRLDGAVCVQSEGNVDASIFLHSFVQMYMKGGGRAVIISFCQTYHHYQLIGKKMGYNLDGPGSPPTKSLFVDGLTDLCVEQHDEQLWGPTQFPTITNFLKESASAVTSISKFIAAQDQHDGGNHATVVVVDGIAEAVAAGVTAHNMLRFLHQLRAVVEARGDGSALVFHLHADALPETGDVILTQLPFMAKTVLTAKALATGASASVHGLLSCQRRDGAAVTLPARDVHYKTKETGIALFPIGSGAGLL